jgi:hypothetical protein
MAEKVRNNVDLSAFPSDLVEQTRIRIQNECRVQEEAIRENIVAEDDAQYSSRYLRASSTRRRSSHIKLPAQSENSPAKISLASFPQDLVKQARAEVQAIVQDRRELVEQNNTPLDRGSRRRGRPVGTRSYSTN